MTSDLRLIRQYLAGRDGAFEHLFDRHNASLYAFCHHLSSNPEDAEDLCQTAWVQAIRSLPTYRATGSFRAWLHAIALNLHRGALRRPGIETVAFDPADLPSTHGDPAGLVERREAGRRVRAALDALDPAHREVLILHEIQGFKYREIGQILDCPIGTVKSRIHHAVAALRAALQETPVAEEVTDDV